MDNTQKIVVWTGRVCAVAIPLAVLLAWYRVGGAPVAQDSSMKQSMVKKEATGFAASAHIAAEAWRSVDASPMVVKTDAASMSPFVSRYRLAGTFFAFGEATEAAGRAIIDDLQGKMQTIARVGDLIDGYRMVEVGTDRAVFEKAAERVTLSLGFQGPARSAPVLATATNSAGTDDEEHVLEQSAFGKRVAETRWVLNRQALMAYYQDLLENPERIASLYSSMKPDYRNEEIAGYRVNQEGERDFFKAMGFREGDVVRKVNSMNMTSQARAEYFIGEFVKTRLNAVVIDVERDGKQQKMIYLIR